MFTLYHADGIIMPILTFELICLLLAAWKAPAKVKEIGLLALISGFFWMLLSLFHSCAAIQQAGGISESLFAGGFRICLIAPMYGMLIYALSLLIRIAQKPWR